MQTADETTTLVAVTKMQGARNDFVVVDCRAQTLADPSAFARWACDRHSGIGADGVLTIEPSRVADVRMRVINADGREAEMCGNGIRCVARLLDERGEGDALRIETPAGTIGTVVISRMPVYRVRVEMGTPVILPRSLPVEHARYVELGNPHLVLLRASFEDVDLAELGARLQHDPAFPDGVNVHVVVALDARTIRVRHYERGVGETQACGTGAVASAAAALDAGLVQAPVNVFVPGGELLVEWEPGGAARLTGPAERVFDSTVAFPAEIRA